MKNGRALAFDIGGTKIASAIVEIEGSGYKILDYKKNDTPQGRGGIVAKILELSEFYKNKYKFNTIGLAVAGQINAKGDTAVYSPNIPSLNNFKLAKTIEQKTGCRVSMRNDVQCFALGEDRFGKYKNYDNAIFVAVGTGIGGAMKINGKFYFGADNIAGEFGHMVIVKDGLECSCGRRGCWERYFSGPALERAYEETYGRKKKAKDIVCGTIAGNKEDKKVLLEASAYFAAGIVNLVNIFNSEIIIAGGSMAREKAIADLVIPVVRKQALLPARKTKIARSSLGYKAFLLGAVSD